MGNNNGDATSNSNPAAAQRRVRKHPSSEACGVPAGGSDEKTCFVISPIGAPGSETRKHMDEVYECIIKPALLDKGYTPYRGDHKARPGRITQHIIKSIMQDALIVCVLTEANPNVYYELAIAESAARPIVVLKHKDDPIPFDVKDVRIIEYDLNPREIWDEIYIDQVVEAIEHLETDIKEDGYLVPFAPELSPLAANPLNFKMVQQYTEISTDVPTVAANAEKQFYICGISLSNWAENQALKKTLLAQAKKDVDIRILVMDPLHPALEHMVGRKDTERVKSDIERALAHWKELSDEDGKISVRKVTEGIIYQQAALNESEMVWTPHMFRYPTGDSPAIRFYREDKETLTSLSEQKGLSKFRQAIENEIVELWERNPDDENSPAGTKGDKRRQRRAKGDE